jgi:hypothetical protein
MRRYRRATGAVAWVGLLLLAGCGPAPSATPVVVAPPATPAVAATPAPNPTGRPTATDTAEATKAPAAPAVTVTASPTTGSAATASTATGSTATGSPTPAATAIDCAVLPAGGFLLIWQDNPQVQASLGCPTSYHPRVTPAAWEVTTSYQEFERGAMLWSDRMGWYAQPVVYVLHADATYQRVPDTFDAEVDPGSGGEGPPEGLVEPVDRFGKVWREGPGVRESLGWATLSETPGVGRFQMFEGGEMLWLSQTGQSYVLGSDGVLVFDVPF